ncbi:MAG TPA: metallopeptidase TldD-related protein [Actinomycetota bacterium]|nr:metallopeptidase TldD-related protein [Actinomycetota bacterium]
MREVPLDRDEARVAAGHVLDHPGADGIEVVAMGSRTALTRFARSGIIQNTVREEVRAYVRAIVGDRIATAATTQLDAEHMRRAADSALEAARASRPDAEWPGLARPEDVGRPEPLGRWDDDTAAATPAQRADAVRAILAATEGTEAAGIYETSAHAYAVMSSAGVDCHDMFTRCITTCLTDTGESTGWGEASSHRAADVDHAAAARRSIAKANAGPARADAAAAGYEVVLEPAAVATLLEYLSYAGLGAKQVIDGESFLSSRSGETVAAPEVTLADDVTHPCSVGIAFDFEGVPRRRVPVIERGRALGPVTDLRTARKLGTESTGHNSGSAEFGPYASNLVLGEGDRALDELVGGVDDGLLITRFHYVNILDRPQTLLTGMTRDGTFRIRGGEVAEPMHNLRFTQSVLDALSGTRGIGRDLVAVAPEYGSFGSTAAPALHVGEFRFTSTTSH